MGIKSLVINPGSTSTKIGVYEDETLLFDETFRHSVEEISKYPTVESQKDFRKSKILELFATNNFDVHSLDMVVGRGGLLKPISGGTYEVTDELLHDLEIGRQGKHACNLGGILAREIADEIGVKSFIVDPPVADEMIDVARVSGVPELPRISAFHVLNQKAVAKRFAKENGKKYEDVNLIIVHMGGGVSVGAHEKGKVVDVFNALDGDGALSTDRAGCVPSGALIKMCFSGEYTEKEVYKKIVGEGGIKAYLGTTDMKKIDQMVSEGVKKAKLIRDAFVYQVSKNISALACVLKGRVDQIIMTGGIAYDKFVVEGLKEAIDWIAPITVYPGEDELLALAQGGLRVMRKEEKVQIY